MKMQFVTVDGGWRKRWIVYWWIVAAGIKWQAEDRGVSKDSQSKGIQIRKRC